jgi:pimeloyl-ACP methyl ester carboxylesterase
MSAAQRPDGLSTRSVAVNGLDCRVWEKGQGAPVGFLAGLGGLPSWPPFLDRLGERHRVVVPSLPGFPGALGHDRLDDIADWITAVLDLLDGASLSGADLIGASVGGMLAAEVAALSRASVKHLVLIAPFGLYDDADPTADPFATTPENLPGLLAANPDRLAERLSAPDGADAAEWAIELTRAHTAAARLLWPFGDRGLGKRLHRITARTLIVWGSADRILPPTYADRFARKIAGPTTVHKIEAAGHLVDVDAPDELARAVDEFLRGV